MLVSTAGRGKENASLTLAQIEELGLASFLGHMQLTRYEERARPSEPKVKADNYLHVIKQAVVTTNSQNRTGSSCKPAWLLEQQHSPLQRGSAPHPAKWAAYSEQWACDLHVIFQSLQKPIVKKPFKGSYKKQGKSDQRKWTV
ncbi:transmembrane protein 140 isoform X3 [Parus major]|uniref:transmembrane protein 140 isoform X3 n=1 Tax=Parus major TaxID=9157 RepID=UPI0008F53BC0|nr:transmembrane protein 140 isoform X3 [Parus major]